MSTQLDINDQFNIAARFINETSQSLFITGNAGTGKTTFLNHIRHTLSKNIVVTAPTGVAAINAKGMTLHSLFQLPFGPFIPTDEYKKQLQDNVRQNKNKLETIRRMDLLVIDEISMVRADVLDAVDTIMRRIRGNYSKPFGGVQLLLLGDLHQLPPVARTKEWDLLKEYYPTPYFFSAQAMNEAKPLMIEFTKIYRQQDLRFIDLLAKVRNQRMDDLSFRLLKERVKPDFSPPDSEKYIILTSHNALAETKNNLNLNALKAPATTYAAEIEGEFSESQYPNEVNLKLKPGAQVMFLRNDSAGQYYNGKLGVVKSCNNESVTVTCEDTECTVGFETWENTQYYKNSSNGILEQKVTGTFSQIPLRLAWAITIHKSQGLTFDKVMIDAGAAFSSGQVYVALSRCRSLEGIVLLSGIPPEAIYTDSRIGSGMAGLKSEINTSEVLMSARKKFWLECAEKLFDLEKMQRLSKKLAFEINTNKVYFEAGNSEWSNQLKADIENLHATCQKFFLQLNELSGRTSDVNENIDLVNRIRDAGNYFLPKLKEIKTNLSNHPIRTELKEVSVKPTEWLTELSATLSVLISLMEQCYKNFNVQQFLAARLNHATKKKIISSYVADTNQTDENSSDNILLTRLKKWRNTLSKEQDKPVYMIASKNALNDIADLLPLTEAQLLKINGIGPRKVETFGSEILEIVSQYCEEFQIVPQFDFNSAVIDPPSIKIKKPASDKKPTAHTSLELFNSGLSLADIAKERNLALSTIETHMIDCIKSKLIDPGYFIDLNIFEQVVFASQKVTGENWLRQYKELLPPEITYFQIRAALFKLEQENALSSENQVIGPIVS